MLFSIYFSLYRVPTLLTYFSPPEVATTPTILRMCNGRYLVISMYDVVTWGLSMCMNVRLVDVYGCETWCVYGWFLYAYGNETWIIVIVVDDRDHIIVKMCWLLYYIYVCEFCILKIGWKLEMSIVGTPGIYYFGQLGNKPLKKGLQYFERLVPSPPKIGWC
jgi:hypothetical protein